MDKREWFASEILIHPKDKVNGIRYHALFSLHVFFRGLMALNSLEQLFVSMDQTVFKD